MAKASTAAPDNKSLVPNLPDLRTIIERFKLPAIDVNLLAESTRKDVQALVAANEVAQRSVDTLVRRQAELLAQTLNQWQAETKDLFTGKTAAETASRQVEQAQQALGRAIGNAREIAEFVGQSHEQMTEILKRRIQEGVEDLQSRLQLTR